MTTATITPDSTMAEILQAWPGARRALFRRYHIGGCSSCGFSMEETLGQLCTRNENLPVEEVIEHIRTSHEQDQQMFLTPKEYQKIREEGADHLLIDVRSREEHEAVALSGSILLTREFIQELMATGERSKLTVFLDHAGHHSLDVGSYFTGHGFTNIKCLRGGIDQWAEEVDNTLPRYQLEGQ